MAAHQSEGSVLVSLFERGPLDPRFALERILSDDALGARAIAFDREAHRRVVVRLGRPRSADVDVVLERLAELRHGKRAELVTSGRHRELVYAVSAMESGRRLPELLEEVGRLRLREFAPIASQLLMPIADAHSRGMDLGGVRIDDVFVQERNGRALLVKVIDLGLRRVFAAPSDETIDDPNPVDPLRSDVFAVGMIFARLLTGIDLRARGAELWWASQRHDAEIGPELVQLVGQALDRDPSRRPSDAQALVEALIDCVPSPMFRLPVADGSPCGDTGRFASSWLSSPSHSGPVIEPRPTIEPPPTSATTFSLEAATPKKAQRVGLLAIVPILLVGIGIVSASSWPESPVEPRAAATVVEAEPVGEPPVAAPPVAAPRPSDDSPVGAIEGEVVIASTPPGELYIDGKPVGSTPFARPLPLGRHDLEIVSDGHETWTATVVVQPGETSRFDVTRADLRSEARSRKAARKPRPRATKPEAKPEPVANRRPFLGRGTASESSRDAFLPPTR